MTTRIPNNIKQPLMDSAPLTEQEISRTIKAAGPRWVFIPRTEVIAQAREVLYTEADALKSWEDVA